jgi:hypothetical protein
MVSRSLTGAGRVEAEGGWMGWMERCKMCKMKKSKGRLEE